MALGDRINALGFDAFFRYKYAHSRNYIQIPGSALSNAAEQAGRAAGASVQQQHAYENLLDDDPEPLVHLIIVLRAMHQGCIPFSSWFVDEIDFGKNPKHGFFAKAITPEVSPSKRWIAWVQMEPLLPAP